MSNRIGRLTRHFCILFKRFGTSAKLQTYHGPVFYFCDEKSWGLIWKRFIITFSPRWDFERFFLGCLCRGKTKAARLTRKKRHHEVGTCFSSNQNMLCLAIGGTNKKSRPARQTGALEHSGNKSARIWPIPKIKKSTELQSLATNLWPRLLSVIF